MRRELRISRPAHEVWAIAGDPSRFHEWFPGVSGDTIEGRDWLVTADSGLAIPHEILIIDPLLRRFQYRVALPFVTEHLSTIDVIELDEGSCLVVYSCDADPATMALIIGGAGGHALETLRDMAEGHT